MRFRASAAALLILVPASVLAGCGGSQSPRGDRPVSLVLDFTTNAVHAGIYLAHARGYDDAEGVPISIRRPSQSTDSVTRLLSGRADFAIMDIHDLAIARQQGADVVGVMALVQTPLAAVITAPGVRSPRQLQGRSAGVTGLPSDVAVLRSVVRGAGGDPAQVRRVTIGFTAVQSLLGGRVDAVTAFWNVEGVELAARRPGFRQFRVERYGAPSYPELVLTTSRELLQDEPDLVKATVRALRRGYGEAIADPESAVTALTAADRSLRASTATAQLRAVSPSFTAGAGDYGDLDRDVLARWARWERRFGIVRRTPDIAQMFRFGL